MEIAKFRIFIVAKQLGAPSSKYIEKWQNDNIKAIDPIGGRSGRVKVNEITVGKRSFIIAIKANIKRQSKRQYTECLEYKKIWRLLRVSRTEQKYKRSDKLWIHLYSIPCVERMAYSLS
jgi:hypothetical protein